jgi:hypothetical protein
MPIYGYEGGDCHDQDDFLANDGQATASNYSPDNQAVSVQGGPNLCMADGQSGSFVSSFLLILLIFNNHHFGFSSRGLQIQNFHQ